MCHPVLERGEGLWWQPERVSGILCVPMKSPTTRAMALSRNDLPASHCPCLLGPNPWPLFGGSQHFAVPSPCWQLLVVFGLILSPCDGPGDTSTRQVHGLVPGGGHRLLLVPQCPEPLTPLLAGVQQGMIKYSCHCCWCLQGILVDLATYTHTHTPPPPPPPPPAAHALLLAQNQT